MPYIQSAIVIARLNHGKPFSPRDDPLDLTEKFFFLRPHLRQFIAECGNRHLFIHKFIISHSAVFGTFFCAVLPQAFGTPDRDYVHFATDIADALMELKDIYPEEYARYYPAYAAVNDDEALAERVRLLNPLEFIGTEEKNKQAKHYRIRVGAADVDTSLSVSMALALQCCKTVF